MKELIVRERQVGDVVALDLEGSITMGEDNAMLLGVVHRLLAENKIKILLNLADVRLVDSSGLGTLICAYTMIRRAGGQVKLLHVSRNIQDVMAITKLSTVFEVHEDESTATNEYTLGEQYELIPYKGELAPEDTPDGKLYAWVEPRKK